MRVTFLAVNYAPSVGGAQTLVRRLAEGLVSRHGHEVTVVTTDTLHAPAGQNPGHVPTGREWMNGVEVVRLPVARRLHTALRLTRRVRARIGRHPGATPMAVGPLGARLGLASLRLARRSDVVVGVSAPYTTVMTGQPLARRLRTPFVALPLLHLGKWQPGERVCRTLRRADRCVALTDFERDWMVTTAGVERGSVVVVPLGCDPVHAPTSRDDARHRLGLPAGPVVLMLGRLVPQKGIRTLLAAVPRLLAARPDTTVVLAGSRTGWAGLTNALDGLGRDADRVVVHEDFDDEQREVLLAAADVVVMPSREESFGLVILEAWASQRPVVASDLASIGSFLRDGVDGLLVPPDDVDRWATAVLDLLDAPEGAATMGAAGHSRISSEFDWSTVVDRWHEELLAAARGQRANAARTV